MRRILGFALGVLLLSLVAQPAQGQKKAKIEDLIKELDAKNTANIRTNALREIGDLAAVKLKWARMAQPQIQDMLDKDASPQIRSASLVCIGKIESDVKNFVPIMLKYLKEDKDFGVQNTALAQLASYQQDAAPAVEPLKQRMLELREMNKDQDPGNMRVAILNTIVQIDQNQSLPTSMEALEKDPALPVKMAVLGRLNQLGQQNRNAAKAAMPLLLKTYEESLKAGPSADLRRGILGALSSIEPNPKSYMALLMETLNKDKEPASVVGVIAAFGRGEETPKEAIPLVLDASKSALANIPKDGGDPNGQRRIIVESIGKIGIEPKELVALLVATLKRERDLGVRAATLAALAGMGDKAKEAIPTVAAAAKANNAVGAKDPNDPADLRRITLETLAKIGPDPKELVTFLTDGVNKDKNPAVRMTSVKLLGDVGAPAKSALPTLTRLQKLPKNASEQDKALAKLAAEAAEKIQAK